MRLFTKEFRLTLKATLPVLLIAGCVSIAPIEPVKNPPLKYRANSTVLVEFVHPTQIGMRCAERGATAHGVPIAMACADRGLMTMPNPCATLTAGKYARSLCDQKRNPAARQDAFSQISLASIDPRVRPRAIGEARIDSRKFIVEFVRPEDVEERCRARALKVRSGASDAYQSCGNEYLITVANPCLQMGSGWYARTMCHELGHVNGWSVDHRGGSYRSDKSVGIDPNNIPPSNDIVEIMRAKDVPPPASSSPAYLAYKAKGQQLLAGNQAEPETNEPAPAKTFTRLDGSVKLRGRLSEKALIFEAMQYSLLVDEF